MVQRKIYLIGSLKNPKIRQTADYLRGEGHFVFDDWHAAGPDADRHWRLYEQAKGNNYAQGLQGAEAIKNFKFDYENLVQADTGVLVMPAGKSGAWELGFLHGLGRQTFVLYPDGFPQEDWDLMFGGCYIHGGGVYNHIFQLADALAMPIPKFVSLVDQLPMTHVRA